MYLAIGSTVVIGKQTSPPPNTTAVAFAGIRVVLNQQIPITGSTHGLTVNAVHIGLALTPLVRADIVVASSTSTINGC